jgi:chromosome segregation ATPase
VKKLETSSAKLRVKLKAQAEEIETLQFKESQLKAGNTAEGDMLRQERKQRTVLEEQLTEATQGLAAAKQEVDGLKKSQKQLQQLHEQTKTELKTQASVAQGHDEALQAAVAELAVLQTTHREAQRTAQQELAQAVAAHQQLLTQMETTTRDQKSAIELKLAEQERAHSAAMADLQRAHDVALAQAHDATQSTAESQVHAIESELAQRRIELAAAQAEVEEVTSNSSKDVEDLHKQLVDAKRQLREAKRGRTEAEGQAIELKTQLVDKALIAQQTQDELTSLQLKQSQMKASFDAARQQQKETTARRQSELQQQLSEAQAQLKANKGAGEKLLDAQVCSP